MCEVKKFIFVLIWYNLLKVKKINQDRKNENASFFINFKILILENKCLK